MASNDEYQQKTWLDRLDEECQYLINKRNELIDVILEKEESEIVTFINLEINNN